MRDQPLIGILGGSGIYHLPGLADIREITVDTPFGAPSDSIRLGKMQGRQIAFLARHGRHHALTPAEIPHRANIFAMKKLGVRWLAGFSAVGSLKEELRPGHFVVPSQFFDRTKSSTEHTFFGKGIVAHVSFGNPVCERLATILFQSAQTVGATAHWGGTYVNMEGPAFSTRAEAEFYRSQNFDVIGMTNLAEAKLAREAEISYATLAMITDYDCWRKGGEEVTSEQVRQTMTNNARYAGLTVNHLVAHIPLNEKTSCHTALNNAFLTPREHWPAATVDRLRPVLVPYLG